MIPDEKTELLAMAAGWRQRAAGLQAEGEPHHFAVASVMETLASELESHIAMLDEPGSGPAVISRATGQATPPGGQK